MTIEELERVLPKEDKSKARKILDIADGVAVHMNVSRDEALRSIITLLYMVPFKNRLLLNGRRYMCLTLDD